MSSEPGIRPSRATGPQLAAPPARSRQTRRSKTGKSHFQTLLPGPGPATNQRKHPSEPIVAHLLTTATFHVINTSSTNAASKYVKCQTTLVPFSDTPCDHAGPRQIMKISETPSAKPQPDLLKYNTRRPPPSLYPPRRITLPDAPM
jgi:hypothetical protein